MKMTVDEVGRISKNAMEKMQAIVSSLDIRLPSPQAGVPRFTGLKPWVKDVNLMMLPPEEVVEVPDDIQESIGFVGQWVYFDPDFEKTAYYVNVPQHCGGPFYRGQMFDIGEDRITFAWEPELIKKAILDGRAHLVKLLKSHGIEVA